VRLTKDLPSPREKRPRRAVLALSAMSSSEYFLPMTACARRGTTWIARVWSEVRLLSLGKRSEVPALASLNALLLPRAT